jgi:hypothetical protein
MKCAAGSPAVRRDNRLAHLKIRSRAGEVNAAVAEDLGKVPDPGRGGQHLEGLFQSEVHAVGFATESQIDA